VIGREIGLHRTVDRAPEQDEISGSRSLRTLHPDSVGLVPLCTNDRGNDYTRTDATAMYRCQNNARGERFWRGAEPLWRSGWPAVPG